MDKTALDLDRSYNADMYHVNEKNGINLTENKKYRHAIYTSSTYIPFSSKNLVETEI